MASRGLPGIAALTQLTAEQHNEYMLDQHQRSQNVSSSLRRDMLDRQALNMMDPLRPPAAQNTTHTVFREDVDPNGQVWRMTVNGPGSGSNNLVLQSTSPRLGSRLTRAEARRIVNSLNRDTNQAARASQSGTANLAGHPGSAQPVPPGAANPPPEATDHAGSTTSPDNTSRTSTSDNWNTTATIQADASMELSARTENPVDATQTHTDVPVSNTTSNAAQVTMATEVYILSGRNGPQALLLNGASEMYVTPPAARQPPTTQQFYYLQSHPNYQTQQQAYLSQVNQQQQVYLSQLHQQQAAQQQAYLNQLHHHHLAAQQAAQQQHALLSQAYLNQARFNQAYHHQFEPTQPSYAHLLHANHPPRPQITPGHPSWATQPPVGQPQAQQGGHVNFQRPEQLQAQQGGHMQFIRGGHDAQMRYPQTQQDQPAQVAQPAQPAQAAQQPQQPPQQPEAELPPRVHGARRQVPVRPFQGHPNNPGAVALVAAAWPHIWLIIRLIVFVWWFTSNDPSWSRWATMVAIAIAVFVLNTGILNGLANQAWDPLRQHLEGLIPLADPNRPLRVGRPAPLARPAAANANTRHDDVTAVASRGPTEPDPAQTAARLLAERRNANWLVDQLRRLERASILFLASIAPGVAERHIAHLEEQERLERQRREAEAASNEQENGGEEEAQQQGEERGDPVNEPIPEEVPLIQV